MKQMKRILIIIMAVIISIGFISMQSMNVSAATKIKISHTKATIKVNQSIQLSLNGAYGIPDWTSSNEKVAIVENGNVKGIKTGKATITAEVIDSDFNLKKLTCVVTVKKETESKPLQKFIDTLKKNAGSNIKDSLIGNFEDITGYAVVDINSDGIDELIVYRADKKVLIVITVKGGKAIKVGEISNVPTDYGYSLNKKTSAIVNIYEGGYSIFKSWYFKDNKLKVYNDRLIEKYSHNGGSYYQGKEGEKTITKKKYSEIVNKYYNSKDLSPINFTSLIHLSETTVSLVAGKSISLKLLGTSEEPYWRIYGDIGGEIATVDEEGNVSTFKEGSVTVRAELYGISYSCDIEILNPYLENISYDYTRTYEEYGGGWIYDSEKAIENRFNSWRLRMIVPKNWTSNVDRKPDEPYNMAMTLKSIEKNENSTIDVYMTDGREYKEFYGKYDTFEDFKEKVSKVQFTKEAILKALTTEVSTTAKIISYKEEDYKAHNYEFYKVEYVASYTVDGKEFTCKKTIYDRFFDDYRLLVVATDLGETANTDFGTVLNDFINTVLRVK